MRAFFNAMNLTTEQIGDLIKAIKHYQYHHISISSPQFDDYEVILRLLSNYKNSDDSDD
jgi:hypothetical protein